MSSKKNKTKKGKSAPVLSEIIEVERLRQDIYRSDMEKLNLFTQMLRVNTLFKNARVSHK
jgi:hypothetical protein